MKKRKIIKHKKIDKVREDEKQQQIPSLVLCKGDKSDDYASKIYEIYKAGAPISQDTKVL
ncbi:MAG: hypothetical protein IPG15_02975 [Arcobacter sp.]|nr:hypothetical protein [Arcobacter sp.]